MGSTFSQKYSKLTFGPLSLISLFYLGKTKKDRLRVNCKAFFTWVGDGVGGLLGGDKAYQKLALEHHPDKLRLKLSREPSDAEIVASEKRFNEIQEAHDVLSAIHAAERELAKERTTSRETQTDGADAREAQEGGVGEEAKEEL